MHPSTTLSGRTPRRRPPARRRSLYLGMAAAGAVLVNVLAGGEPAAQAGGTATEPVSVAEQLGMTVPHTDRTPDLQPLEQLAASRSTREAQQVAAQQVQAAAERAAGEKVAAEQAAADRAAADQAAAEQAAQDEAARDEAAQDKAAQGKVATGQTAADEAEARAAASPAPASAGRSSSAAGPAPSGARVSNTAGPVKPAAQAAADVVVSSVPGAASITIGGTRPSATDPHGHPSGLALDYMVNANEALGDAIVAFHIAHWDELGVEYVIWQQRMLSAPDGAWQPMEDRGSPTANHMDHPHVNYEG